MKFPIPVAFSLYCSVIFRLLQTVILSPLFTAIVINHLPCYKQGFFGPVESPLNNASLADVI